MPITIDKLLGEPLLHNHSANDVSSVTDKNFVTDAQLSILNNTSGTNTGDQDLSGYQATSLKGVSNGYASLDSAGKVPIGQLPSSIMSYQGTWDASTNTPTLADGVSNSDDDIGNVYRVTVAGSQDLGSGSISFSIGDYVILNASKVWEKSDTTDSVASVFGRTGVVTAQTNDYTWSQIDKTTSSINDITTKTHNLLTGLDSDDHTQYVLLAGRSGGQTIYGGTAAGNNLTLESTSNATKGVVYINGNVGIGTTSPSYKLQVSGALGIDGGYGTVGTSPNKLVFGSPSGSGGTPNAGSLAFGDNTGWKYHIGTNVSSTFTPRVTFMDTGNVGIGTASPAYKLDINGTSNTVGVRVASSTANDILYYGTGTVTGDIYLLSSGISATGSVQMDVLNTNSTSSTANSLLRLATTGANSGDPLINFSITGQQDWAIGVDNSDSDKFKIGYSSNFNTNNVFTADTAGNVGIGTTAPSYKLDVNGTSRFTDWVNIANNKGLQLLGDAYIKRNLNILAVGSNDTYLGTNTVSGNIYFKTGDAVTGTERMRITSTGNVGIGTIAPDYKFHVEINENASIPATVMQLSNAFSGQDIDWRFKLNSSKDLRIESTSANSDFSISPSTAALNAFYITNSGNVGIGTTTPGAKLHVNGTTDGQQLVVEGHTTQTANLTEWQNSSGTVLSGIDSGGVLLLGETTTPTAVANYGKVYPKADNNLYFQDGAGTEKTILDSEDTLNFDVAITFYDAQPTRASENNIMGGLLSLATAQPLDSTPTDLVVTKGVGKLFIVVNAGSDINGTITITGEKIDRNTGASTPGHTNTITVDALTTDNSTTDSNGNTKHSFVGGYVSDDWFTGTVTLSTTDLTLTDVDVYHISFHQFNDKPNIILDSFDVSLYTTNVAAEFDGYLFCLEKKDGNKADITLCSELHVGADGETAIANKYWRVRKGNLAKAIDGTTDGVWVDMHYSNSPAYVEDVTMIVNAQRTVSMTS